MIYILSGSWSVSTLIDSLDLDISHFSFQRKGEHRDNESYIKEDLNIYVNVILSSKAELSFNRKEIYFLAENIRKWQYI